jgi:hypothetical protein
MLTLMQVFKSVQELFESCGRDLAPWKGIPRVESAERPSRREKTEDEDE